MMEAANKPETNNMNVAQFSTRRRRDEHSMTSGRQASRRPSWHDLAERFPGERECLASYLALEAAEVIGGVKPANLLNLVDRQRPCGRNLYQLWHRHGQQLLAESGLAARELVQRDDSTLLLIYHPANMKAHLDTPKVANFLRRVGYHQPAKMEQLFEELAARFSAGGFPHEIGAILGYPLKDVAGFMGWARLPVTSQGPWKIYGDPRPSLDVVAACRRCREEMARRLRRGDRPFDCLEQSCRTPLFFANN
jgi:hypothetical protein